jgi:hypothetical protein
MRHLILGPDVLEMRSAMPVTSASDRPAAAAAAAGARKPAGAAPGSWPARPTAARRRSAGARARCPGPRTSMSRLPTMGVSRLLKSWATPPVSWPIASIFWAWRSASCAPQAPPAAPFRRDVAADRVDEIARRARRPGNPAVAAVRRPVAVLEPESGRSGAQLAHFGERRLLVVRWTRSMKLVPTSWSWVQPSRVVHAGLTELMVPSKRATSMMSVDSRHMRSRSAVRSATCASSVSLSSRSRSSLARKRLLGSFWSVVSIWMPSQISDPSGCSAARR